MLYIYICKHIVPTHTYVCIWHLTTARVLDDQVDLLNNNTTNNNTNDNDNDTTIITTTTTTTNNEHK